MRDTPDMPDTFSFRAWREGRPPAVGSAVMATGIISIGLHLTGDETLSRIALVLASVAWIGLAADFAVRLVGDREQWLRQAGTPAGLTAVAASSVLGTRFSELGWQGAAEALLALSAVLWPILLLAVVRHRRRRMEGGVFLVCVATQGLSVLGSTIATAVGSDWLAHAAMVLFWLGIVFYGVSFAHFDLWELKRGAGDQWVAGGALGISALAGSRLVAAHHVNPYLWNNDDQGVLRAATAALLVLDLVCYCVLLVTEVVWPRLRYDTRRWATVFPMGMTAVAALSVASALGVFWLKGTGHVLLWIAVAAWLVAATGAVLAVRSATRR
ncbi:MULTISPECIES: tellurite resistance/C4-dicarboxylate transporter family protein [unclassified Streptomyces]|jgi:C4-dicarboxylate transporter/malic acid transport protein.|uniref:tellurite resistance/C4-dicarboxylate transporter family protein n=1 Tax=unclassified Streptomyces TaxID=2593676 RepID=UPI002E26DBF5